MSEQADHWQFQPGEHRDDICEECSKTGLVLGNRFKLYEKPDVYVYYCRDCSLRLTLS